MFPKFSAGSVQDYGFFARRLVFGLAVPGALPSMPTFAVTVSGVAFFARVFFAGMATSGLSGPLHPLTRNPNKIQVGHQPCYVLKRTTTMRESNLDGC